MQSNINRNQIVELDLNEIETVVGGLTYSATLAYSSTTTSMTYVKPTSTSTTLSSTSVSSLLKLI